MKLIVGLGNPGEKFKNTRHNLGYMVAEGFAKSNALSWRYSPDFMGFYIKTNDFVLLKPSTYMNKSGESVSTVANYFKIKNADLLAIHDDLDLSFGKIRISFDSTSAGHKGIESIIASRGSMDFARLRVGIGRPSQKDDSEEFVLEKFSNQEEEELPQIIAKSVAAAKSFLNDGIEATMNQFN